MRHGEREGGFWLCLFFNAFLTLWWTIPAWILLVLHFTINLWLGWFIIALGLWVLGLFFWTLFIRFAAQASSEPTPYRENKNPYSKKQ